MAHKHLRSEKRVLAVSMHRQAIRLRAQGAPLLPKRALALAQELLTRGVQAFKADS